MRPTELNDPRVDLTPITLLTVDIEAVKLLPDLAQDIFTAIRSAVIDEEMSWDGTRLTRNLTEAQKQSRLVSAQEIWDYASRRYLKALDDPASAQVWERNRINSFAAEEGLDPIVFPEKETAQ